MARIEDITKDSVIRGILPNALVTIVDAKWYGSDVVEATYKTADGKLGTQHDERATRWGQTPLGRG